MCHIMALMTREGYGIIERLKWIALCAFGWLALTPSATAQPIMWTQDALYEAAPKLAKDASSNLYVGSLAFTSRAALLIVKRLDRNGNIAWRTEVDVTPSIGQGYSGVIASLKVNNSRVFACVTTGASSTNDVESRVVSFSIGDGSALQRISTNIQTAAQIGVTNDHLVMVGRDSSLNMEVEYLSQSTLALQSSGLLSTDAVFTSDVAVDGAGNSYLSITRIGNVPVIVRVKPDSTIAWSRNFDSASRTNESVLDLDIDPQQNRVFAVGTGKNGTEDTPMVGIYSMTSGGIVSLSNPTGNTFTRCTQVAPIPGAGAIVAEGFGTITLFRVSSSGVLAWEASSVAGSMPGDSIHFDPDGNIVHAYTSGSTNASVRRVDVSTGHALSTLGFTRANPSTLAGSVTDASGASYALFELDTLVRIQRVQAAELRLPTLSPTGGFPASTRIQLAAPAPSAQTWLLTSSNTSIATVPPAVIVNSGSLLVTFSITTIPVGVSTSCSIFARSGGLVLAKTLTVLAPSLQFVSVSPQASVGGTPITGVAQITGPAPTGGRTINLSVSKPDVATVQASSLIVAGALVTTFPITTVGVNANQGVVLTGSLGSVSKTFFFAVNAPSLVSLTGPNSIVGGTQGTMTLTIDGIAPAGGRSILLISGAPGIIIVPSSFAVPQGATTVDVPMSTAVVSSATNVVVFATRSGIIKTATVTVTP